MIAACLVGRILSENLAPSFAGSSYYLLCDLQGHVLEEIKNENRDRGIGLQAAQLLANRGVKVVVCGDMDPACRRLLESHSVQVFQGFPATGLEAFKRLTAVPATKPQKNSNRGEVPSFRLIDGEFTFTGGNLLYEDWDFLLNIDTPPGRPKHWLQPRSYSEGMYHLDLQVLEMRQSSSPIAFEFVLMNLPEKSDPQRLHRCSYAHYCCFHQAGRYEHLARIQDMEVTTIDSDVRPWDWSRACDSVFILIKPYGQNPFPLTAHVEVTVYAGD
jgi:predicted Fe-Mo cluster-binding NifX family protein